MSKIQIVSARLADIFPYYDNPRDNRKAIEPVKESFKKFGFIKPIICDKDGVIIAGHTRYVATFQLGLEYVPVIYSDMNSEEAKKYRIVDNKIAEKSEFNETELLEELKKMRMPLSMQAFFFEDIESIINFSIEDFNPQMGEYLNVQEESYEENQEREEYQDRDENGLTVEDKEKEELDPAYGLFKTRTREDGSNWMKVICPYCGNIEEINIEY